jgi:hypothetical protein
MPRLRRAEDIWREATLVRPAAPLTASSSAHVRPMAQPWCCSEQRMFIAQCLALSSLRVMMNPPTRP